MQRLLVSWLLLAAAVLSRPLATDTRPWGGFPTAAPPRAAELLAVPVTRSATLHGTFEAARHSRTQYRHHAGSTGAALPAGPSTKIPSGLSADSRTPLWNDFAGAWPHGFPYYPTGPPHYLI